MLQPNKLYDLRISKGLTQGQLAIILGVSRQTLNRIELGKFEPRLELAQKIAAYFNCSIEEVFFIN